MCYMFLNLLLFCYMKNKKKIAFGKHLLLTFIYPRKVWINGKCFIKPDPFKASQFI